MKNHLHCYRYQRMKWEFSPKDFPEQQSKFWEQKISKFSDLEIFLSFTTGQPHIADRFPHNFI